ncbi:MAG: ABC transporter substrate-binding protein [Betaproteobacteria bacterium]|nr:ABC transporter substrate-binding protein [Betaproteobacteria bacterium]
MNTRKLFISAAQSACWLLAAASSAMAAGAAPDALVKSTVADVVAVIKQNKDKQVLRQLTEQKVLPHFDFKRMTQLAVGKAWREANQTQQQALESGFRTLLVNTYTNVLKRSAAADRVAIDDQPLRGGWIDQGARREEPRAGKKLTHADVIVALEEGVCHVHFKKQRRSPARLGGRDCPPDRPDAQRPIRNLGAGGNAPV